MLYMHCASCGKVLKVPVMRYRIYGLIIMALGVIGWRTYFFAGTGYAFLISCSIVIAGALICFFAHNLACRAIYRSCCPHCGQLNWRFGIPLHRNATNLNISNTESNTLMPRNPK